MSLSDEAMEKFDAVQKKGIQYVTMRVEDIHAPVTVLLPEVEGAKGASYEQFVKDLAKPKDCRFGAFSYMVNRKSHPVVFYWTPHDADAGTALSYTKTNRELKKKDFKGFCEIHATDMDQLDEDFVTSKVQDWF